MFTIYTLSSSAVVCQVTTRHATAPEPVVGYNYGAVPRAPPRRVALGLPVAVPPPSKRHTVARRYSGDDSPLTLAGWL